jgi:hypothetical protein
MSHVRRLNQLPAAFAFLAASVLAVFVMTTPATASVITSGSASISIGQGSAGKGMASAGVRVSAVKPATSSRKKSVTRVAAPVASVSVAGATDVSLGGSLVLKRGARKAAFSELSLRLTPRSAALSGLLGSKRVTFMGGSGKVVIDSVEGRVNLTGMKLSLNSSGAKTLRSRLKLKSLRPGEAGRLSLNATWTEVAPVVDPYFEQCGFQATSKTVGSVPVASALPNTTNGETLVGDPVRWGIKSSLSAYIGGVGSIATLGGTSSSTPAPPLPPFPLFSFPFSSGQLVRNQPGPADDQAVLNSTGTVVYCNAPHGFRISISDPTVVIDGTRSRIIATVDTNISGDWIPAQRVDFASLDVSGVVPVEQPNQIRWSQVPTTLTQAGADALRFCTINVPGAPAGCLYPAGTALDKLSVVAGLGSS